MFWYKEDIFLYEIQQISNLRLSLFGSPYITLFQLRSAFHSLSSDFKMYISKSLCQLAIAAFLGSSLFIKGLAMPVDVTEVSMNNSLEPRGFLRGAFAGALGAHLANKFRDKKKG